MPSFAGTGFILTSPAVKEGEVLPTEFTGDGESATLPLSWSGAPEGTKSYTLIMHHIDPEGKTKWYWTLYNIPAQVTSLEKNNITAGTLGNNSVNHRLEYAPPHSKGPGKKTYIFTVYALSGNIIPGVPAAEVNREVLLTTMKDKLLGAASLSVHYTRNVETGESKEDGQPPPPPRREGEDRSEIYSSWEKLMEIPRKFIFTEGPVWLKEEKSLLFSDIDAEKIYKWSEMKGLAVCREKSGAANGNTLDKTGRLLTCEQKTRQVTRTEKDGTVKVIAGRFEEKRFNSPNDITVSSDGSIWFTDPDYGLKGKAGELPGKYVYKIEITGKLSAVIKELATPNGICFSPDEKYLYVGDSSANTHSVIRYLMDNGMPVKGKTFCVIDNKSPDGIRCDRDGRLYAAAGDGIHIFSPEGKLIGKILTPAWPTNICFGGEDGRTLFITARSSVYYIRLKVDGAK